MANSAQATSLQFNDLASFTAATTTQNIDFEGIAPAGGSVDSRPLNFAGVDFVTVDRFSNGFFGGTVVDAAAPNPFGDTTLPRPYDWGSGASLSNNFFSKFSIFLPSDTTAFGLDLMSAYRQNTEFTIDFATRINGQTIFLDPIRVSTLNYPNRQFVGVTSTTPIEYLTVTLGGGQISLLDNVRFGTANPVTSTAVPEPFTIVGTLVGGTAALRMRKKLKSAGK